MNYNDLELLTRLYNTLLLINTRGEDTILMSDCLKGLHAFVLNKEKELAMASQQETNIEEE